MRVVAAAPTGLVGRTRILFTQALPARLALICVLLSSRSSR